MTPAMAAISEKLGSEADPLATAGLVTTEAERILAEAKSSVRAIVCENTSADQHQEITHGLAWLATYVEALRQ